MSTFSNLPWGIQNSKLNQYLCHNRPNLKGIHNPLGSKVIGQRKMNREVSFLEGKKVLFSVPFRAKVKKNFL